MKKIDIESIYPQAEKDREAERLERLCGMHEGQKNIHADGRRLIENFVTPRRLLALKHPSIVISKQKSPEQNRFLKLIERQAW